MYKNISQKRWGQWDKGQQRAHQQAEKGMDGRREITSLLWKALPVTYKRFQDKSRSYAREWTKG